MSAQLVNIITIGSVEITIASPDYPPYEVDAFVEEQDKSLLLGIETEIREPHEDFNVLVNKIITHKPCSVGDVIIKKTNPMKFMAIIHDIDQKPTWKIEWVERALENIFYEIKKNKVQTIAMPLLGTIHGKLKDRDFINLLRAALPLSKPLYPDKIWLISPAFGSGSILKYLTLH